MSGRSMSACLKNDKDKKDGQPFPVIRAELLTLPFDRK